MKDMENEIEKTIVGFSFDKLNVLGIVGNYVFIEGITNFYDDKCVIKMKKSLFNQTMKLWMKDKQDYCERFGYFCGVNHTETTDYDESGEIEIYDFDEWELDEKSDDMFPVLKKVKLFLVHSIYSECEHG